MAKALADQMNLPRRAGGRGVPTVSRGVPCEFDRKIDSEIDPRLGGEIAVERRAPHQEIGFGFVFWV